jgi:Periplasmic binding protein domain
LLKDAAGISVPFVGPDNRRGAALVGKYLAGKLKPGDEVGIIEGVSADRNAQQRTAGCKDAMNAAGIRIVAIQPGDWEDGKGKEAASAMLSEHPRIRSLVFGNDNMAMGAVEAVHNARRTGRWLPPRIRKSGLSRHHVHAHVMHDPDRSSDQDHSRHDSEPERHHVPLLLRRCIHVQEKHQMHDDLNERQRRNHWNGGTGRHGVFHDNKERRRRENDRQHEADNIRARAAVARAGRLHMCS